MSFHYLQQCGVTPCKIHIRAVFTSWSPHLASPRQVATRVVQGPLRRREGNLTSVTNHIMETNPLAELGTSQTLFSVFTAPTHVTPMTSPSSGSRDVRSCVALIGENATS